MIVPSALSSFEGKQNPKFKAGFNLVFPDAEVLVPGTDYRVVARRSR